MTFIQGVMSDFPELNLCIDDKYKTGLIKFLLYTVDFRM